VEAHNKVIVLELKKRTLVPATFSAKNSPAIKKAATATHLLGSFFFLEFFITMLYFCFFF
jgi:hypothetical protein